MNWPEQEIAPEEHVSHWTGAGWVMLNELLVAGVKLPLEAVSCLFAPTTLIERLLNVASPFESVICVVVPRRLPVPLVRVNVIGMFGVATLVLVLS